MERIEVLKTYKLFIGGQFPRTESGRYYTPAGADGKILGNICQSSRKDFRNAVVAARGGLGNWARRAAYNRGQILYRIGEMLEGRKAQFIDELVLQGCTPADAGVEVAAAVDRCIYYAGWCDKYQAVFSSVNPVSTSHFNFTVQEPVGIVAAIAPEESGLLGVLGTILPIMAGGNSCVLLASQKKPLCAITLGEVLATSDLPGGVVNLLTGFREELLPFMVNHKDVNAFVASDLSKADLTKAREESIHNLKRIIHHREDIAFTESPYFILATQEIKTTWHPIESSISGGSKY